MKIYISEAVKEKDHLVLLVTAESDFSDIITDSSQREWVQERIGKDKKVTVLKTPGKIIIIQVLTREEKPDTWMVESARKAAYALYPVLKDLDITEMTIMNKGVTPKEVIGFTEGIWLSAYQFSKYFTGKKEKPDYMPVSTGIVTSGAGEKDMERLTQVIKAVYRTRDLVNEPLSYLTAEKLSEEITRLGKEAGFSVEVFNKKKIESLRMGGLLAVNNGSQDPPTFSVLEWKPDKAINKKPYILVGKGVVFDTGGLSLKPTLDSMDYMKCDMAGAAAVGGSVYAIASAQLPVWIIGLIPATDNRPDGNAYVPGDVVQMYDGTTVEVLNTDAEGRMILADALAYAKQFGPELVIELSTLTGSAHMAVGKFGIVGMGNAPAETMDKLKKSGENTYERIAEFPFWDEYGDLLTSDIADLKNIGGQYAGAITAGKFLEKFTGYPFIHLDIAGPSYNKSEDNYRGKGASGIGVRLLFDFFSQLTSK